ncbi:MAG: damage-inducible protein DinB [Acidobacteria bacterium]|nr:damage-inducible protein DinB [Acidobacteriota bacterium]MBV9188557.1 damage-inducible protein DinB [Acidobacteriota bacterium]
MLDAVRPLFAHMEWADAMVWRAVRECGAAAADDKTLHDRLYHIHATQTAFLQAWRGEQVVFTGPEDFPGLDAVRGLRRAFYAAAPGYVASLSADAVDREMVLPWSSYFAKRAGFAAHPSTLGETLLQLPSHSTYHRGQVNTRLRELGGTPPLVDFIAWVWAGKPAAKWVKSSTT